MIPEQHHHRTLVGEFELEGVGVHSGKTARVRVCPAPFGAGINFFIDGTKLPAHIDFVVGGPGATILSDGEVTIAVVEHLLAALSAHGVTDAQLFVEGAELPILDGSARPWFEAILEIGVVDGLPIQPLTLLHSVRVEGDEGAFAEIHPADTLVFEISVDFARLSGPVSKLCYTANRDTFDKELSWARTFVMEQEIPGLKAAGLGKGASLTNTLVWTPNGPRNEGGERGDDEVIRHKLLDAIGDIALVGSPILARVVIHRGGHQLNHKLLKEAIAQGALRACEPAPSKCG